jgi:hypothetical protein
MTAPVGMRTTVIDSPIIADIVAPIATAIGSVGLSAAALSKTAFPAGEFSSMRADSKV